MPTFEELINARRTMARPTRDVDILIDTGLAEEIDRVQAEYDEKASSRDRRAGEDNGAKALKSRLDELAGQAAEQMVTFRLTQLPGDVWANVTAPSIPREDVPIDMRYGYDIAGVTKVALPLMARRIDGEELVEIDADDWEVVFDLPGFDDLQDAVFMLQEWEPEQRLQAAKKALRDHLPPTHASPGISGSPSSGSTGGSRGARSASPTTKKAGSPKPSSTRSPSSTPGSAPS